MHIVMINIISVLFVYIIYYCIRYTFIAHDLCDHNRVSLSRSKRRISQHYDRWGGCWVSETEQQFDSLNDNNIIVRIL